MSLIEDAAGALVRSAVAEALERAVERQVTLSVHARTGRLDGAACDFLARRSHAIGLDEPGRHGLEGRRQALVELGYLKRTLFGWRRTGKPAYALRATAGIGAMARAKAATRGKASPEPAGGVRKWTSR